MSPSVADFDVSRLTARARETLETIALPLGDGAKAAELAVRLGISKRDVTERMKELRAELEAQTDGGTLPELREDDYEALKASIAEHGLIYPIIRNWQLEVVDGRNRLRACEELGIQPENIVLARDATPELIHALALTLNIARRHLTVGDRRRIVAAEIIRDPSRSDRAIAGSIGVSHPTVAAVRKELEQRGQVENVSTRVDQRGRRQPAGKPDRPLGNPETRLDYIAEEIRSMAALEDNASAHARADVLVVEALRELGSTAIADAFEALPKGYS